MKTIGYGKANGKIILMGEHAVVYGEPAIAFPFLATKITATIQSCDSFLLHCSYYKGSLEDAPETLNSIKVLINHLQTEYATGPLLATIESTIPAERGMGSSAAVAVALTRAFFDFIDQPLAQETLLSYVEQSERIAHGNPSGIDAAATSGQDPIYFTKGHPFNFFPLNIDAFLVVADTGVKGQTRAAVKDVANLVSSNDGQEIMRHIHLLGALSKEAKEAISENQVQRLADIMNEAQQHLTKLTVSNQLLDQLIQTALATGALGAKLTGGGRGGCMIALTKTKKEAQVVSQALEKQGAVATWIQGLGVHTYA
ncbi:mevalonate kinase [Enterococcus sp. JM4C]|uniref:mevalonate kinase n=1 Tax=Candidatus Enterococcus huntleyi TaxID=1857217 RepID=UPI00137B0305|nr:mevalonate kinase [Enterococcus sp. JM4C]KAF1299550.1 mevalonate kinase [Enterococcus sp. JM4C]